MALRLLPAFALACAFVAPLALAADGIPVVNEGSIRDKWMLKDGVPIAVPAYPAHLAKRGDEVCVAVGYLVNPDGTLTDYALLKTWTSAGGTGEPEPGYWAAFADAAGQALAQWRFQPRPEVTRPQPVFTVGTFVFGSKGETSAVREHCKIPSLVAHLRELGDSNAMRRHPPPILQRLDLHDNDTEQRRRVSTEM